MKPAAKLASVLFLLGSLAAQSVGVAVSALTPLTLQAADGTNSVLANRPAGPLAPFDGFDASLPGNAGGASLTWTYLGNASTSGSFARIEHSLSAVASGPAFTAHAGPHEFLLEFTAATSVAALLTITNHQQVSGGATAPSILLDYDNDGVIDVVDPPTQAPTVLARTFGPQPLRVRVIVDAAASGSSVAVTNALEFALTPDNGLTITEMVSECRGVTPTPAPVAAPIFPGTGIQLTPQGYGGELALVVLGLSPQPLVLGAFAGLPCILLPSPDLILLPSAANPASLPLPAAVRPVTLYAQGVTLLPSGLVVSDGFAIDAH